jgi:hypothetical protein
MTDEPHHQPAHKQPRHCDDSDVISGGEGRDRDPESTHPGEEPITAVDRVDVPEAVATDDRGDHRGEHPDGDGEAIDAEPYGRKIAGGPPQTRSRHRRTHSGHHQHHRPGSGTASGELLK